MPIKTRADYLVVGAGAMGMAFVDTLIAETDATVAIVDRYHQPGGHWNVAYPFVRLHQPSVGYGVNSRPLGNNTVDRNGWNAGLYELASVGEVCAYFDQVMQQTLLPTGRVRYFPMSEYLGEGRVRSLVTGDRFEIEVARKTVDSTYQQVSVPAMRPPLYGVADGVACVAPNALTSLGEHYDRFTIIGAGKTGIDTCLWLLRQRVDPENLTWIMPRDSWLIDRALVQPGPLFADNVARVLAAEVRAVAEAASIVDLFDRLEACGRLIRLDANVRPTMYRCATVSLAELEQLRRIVRVVRLGRVQRIEANSIRLDNGSVSTTAATLHIDCSADGLARRPELPVFDGGRITLQSVRTCQQVFSAAFIAHVEATYTDEAVKNVLCAAIAHPNTDVDYLRTRLADIRNERCWAADDKLQAWLRTSRLNWVRDLGPSLPAEPDKRAEALRQMLDVTEKLRAKFGTLLSA